MTRLLIETFEVLAGTTIKPTWVSAGVTPTSISSALIDRNGTLVHSIAATASGGGYFYAFNPVPNTPDTWYVNEWIAVIATNTYRSRSFINALLPEVD